MEILLCKDIRQILKETFPKINVSCNYCKKWPVRNLPECHIDQQIARKANMGDYSAALKKNSELHWMIDLNQIWNVDLSYQAACIRFHARSYGVLGAAWYRPSCDGSLPIYISKMRAKQWGRPAMPADFTSGFIIYMAINLVARLTTSAYLAIALIARYA